MTSLSKLKTTYDYEIIINEGIFTSEPLFFSYYPIVSIGKKSSQPPERAKYKIELYLGKETARIVVKHKPTKHQYDKVLNGEETILSSAIRKIKMLHLFYYGQILNFTSIFMSCHTSKGKEIFSKPFLYSDETYHEPLYSLLGTQKLKRLFSDEWRTPEFIDAFLNTRLLITERRWAAVAAYACAKSKCFEVERLLYNWTSFNALYGYAGTLINKMIVETQSNTRFGRKKKGPDDSEGVNFYYIWEGHKISQSLELITQDERTKIAEFIGKECISRTTDVNNFIQDISNAQSELWIKIHQKHPEIDPLTFMRVQFPYYMRCDLFHANKTVPILSYENSSYLKGLAIANQLLEEYLEEQLPMYFNDDTTKVVLKKATKAVYSSSEKLFPSNNKKPRDIKF